MKPTNQPTVPQRHLWKAFLHQSGTIPALVILALVLGSGMFGLALSDPGNSSSFESSFAPPSVSHWLGTDIHGRDVVARLLRGTRLSLLVGALGAILSLSIGVLWGAVAGYAGGRWDYMMMRAVDILYSLPNVVFVMIAMVVVEPPIHGWIAARIPPLLPWSRELLLSGLLGAISWLNTARIIRGTVQSLRSEAFIEASRALGASGLRILATHIIPNIAGLAIACAMLAIPSVILYESFLSFLGLGVKPPAASLGTLIADGAAQLNPLRMRWWLLAGPSSVLAASLWSLHRLGISLCEAMENRKKHL